MFGTKEISENLGVKPVTVRKYAGELEKAGYIVAKDDSGHRVFSEKDATAFRHMKTLCEQSGMTVELAAKVVAAKYSGASESVAPVPVPSEAQALERYDERYNTLLDALEQMSEHNRVQAEQVERLHKRMDDQNANITAILREAVETRRMIAAANSRKWWQFWKKDMILPDLSDPETRWKLQQNK